MAVFKVREIAEKLGVKPQTINTWGSRGKLIIIDGEIDDKNPINKGFLDKKTAGKTEIIPPQEKKHSKKNKDITADLPADLQFKMDFAAQESDKLRNEKLKEEIEIAKIKKKKLLGEVVPVDAVKKIFNLHFRNLSVEFYNAIDSYSTIINKKVGGTRQDLAEIRVTLKELLNDHIDKAKVKSKDDIAAIVAEFSEKKGKGEAD